MKHFFLIASLFFLLSPVAAEARYDGEVAGWIPWWTGEAGPESALENLGDLDTVYPFSHEVDFYGTITSRVDFTSGAWEELVEEAQDEGVEVIPTIMWFDGAATHYVLSNAKRRQAHIEQIVDIVEEGGFDGINIDYESMVYLTKKHFTRFLKELDEALGRNKLTCTLEARTPPEDIYHEVPDEVRHAVDFRAVNRYCDWVEIMAYDQQRAILTLNDERRGVPYSPVADNDWVTSVIEVALEEIDNDKLMLGVATYGRAWDVTVAPEWYKSYQSVAALNHPRIVELSRNIYESPVGRDDGGEAVITYFPNDSKYRVLNNWPKPKDTRQGFEAASRALAFANATGQTVKVRYVSWSDARAIRDKLEIAEEYDLRGVAIFKIDGEEDPRLWRLF